MRLVWIGKGLATVGVVCGLIALFEKSLRLPGSPVISYWKLDSTLGWLLLILLVGAALCLAGSYVLEEERLDVGAILLGAVATGLYAWYPILFATRLWDSLGGGVWLGLCTGLVPIGAAIAYVASGAGRLSARSPVAPALILVGGGLVLAGMWTEAGTGFGKYWRLVLATNVATGKAVHTHAVGIFLLISLGLTVALVIAAFAGVPYAREGALATAGVTCGMVLLTPVFVAFDNFGLLGVGSWLAAAGGLVLVAGTAALYGAPRRLRRGEPVPAV
jgi:hypothetical protein